MNTLALSFRKSLVLQFILGLSLLILTAQVSIPIQPVPITLGSVGVLLIALIFEKRQAITIISSYLALGAIGLPVFANFNSGIMYFIGPTGGYLLGFWCAVFAVATLRESMASGTLLRTFLLCLIATAIIYSFGIAWLSYLLSFEKAIKVGLLPFLMPGIVKAGLLASTVRGIKKL